MPTISFKGLTHLKHKLNVYVQLASTYLSTYNLFGPSATPAHNGIMGQGLAWDGTHVFVTAPGKGPLGTATPGKVYYYITSATGTSNEIVLSETSSSSSHLFGYAIACTASWYAISDVGGTTTTCKVYIFPVATLPTTSGNAPTTQTISNPGTSSQFGSSLALNGTTLIVGDPGGTKVYVYKYTTTWSVSQTISAPSGSSGFGTSVSLYGATMVVGAPTDNSGYSHAYVYTNNGTTWSLTQTLTSNTAHEKFGQSVKIKSTGIVIGAPSATAYGSGSVYYYATYSSPAVQLKVASTGTPNILDTTGTTIYGVGTSVDIHDTANAIIAGAPTSSSGMGKAYLFELDNGNWQGASTNPVMTVSGTNGFGNNVLFCKNSIMIA